MSDVKEFYKYKIIRERDGLVFYCNHLIWLEVFPTTGAFKARHRDIAIGRILVLNPDWAYQRFESPVLEILENTDKLIRYKTDVDTYSIEINENLEEGFDEGSL
jgi:hypothetical protein